MKATKQNTRATLILILAILILQNAGALGISPAQDTIRFTPGIPQTLTYTAINNEDNDLNLTIYALGELAEFITFEKTSLIIGKNEATKDFVFTISTPNSLAPGERTGKIVIEEFIPISDNGETQMYAKFKVISKLLINVPYPEKFIDVEVIINDTGSGKPLNITARIKNLGTMDITSLQTTFGIYEDEKLIESEKTSAISLSRGDVIDLVTNLNTTDLRPGSYSAVGTIDYDNNVLEIGRYFNVGEEYINILDYTKYFLAESVNKFDVDVQNEWNKKIRNAYAKISINDGRASDLRSVTYDLEPREKAIMTSFWDTKGTSIGDYDSNITLLYSNKSTGKLGQVHVVSPKEYEKQAIKPGLSTSTLIFIIIAAIAANIILLVALRRKHGNKGNSKKHL